MMVSSMKYRKLGDSQLKVSEIGFGCMSLSSNNEKEALKIIETAIERGVNFFDTADLYEYGLNEQLVGKALKNKRKDVIIATKVGNRWKEDKSGWYWDPSPNYLKEAIYKSLERLGTDYIDLYQLHGGTIDDPMDDIIETFEELKREGVIREYGISSIRPNVIRSFIEKSNITSIMMPYSLLDRRAEEFFPLLKEKQISLIVRGPLCQGILTNKWKDKLKEDGYLDYRKEEVIEVIEKLTTFVDEERELTQIALQYALFDSVVATVIPGASSVTQLMDNLKTVEVSPLTEQEIAKINQWTKTSQFTLHR